MDRGEIDGMGNVDDDNPFFESLCAWTFMKRKLHEGKIQKKASNASSDGTLKINQIVVFFLTLALPFFLHSTLQSPKAEQFNCSLFAC